MNRRVKIILACIGFAGGGLGLTSCKFFNDTEESIPEGEPVARVYDRYLYESDILNIMPEELSGNDSLAFLQNYVNVWAKDQLMIYKAEYNLTDSKKNFENQIRKYRNDLLKFTYRQDYVSQNLDTNISEESLRAYYSEGENNFVLQENILRARYLVVDVEAPDLKRAKKWFRSTDEEDLEKLDDFALKYAYRFSLQDSSWVTFDRIKEILRLEVEEPESFLSGSRYAEREDSTNIYMLEIVDYKLKGDRAPLEYSRDLIENILLNKRKLELIDNLEQSLLNDALEKKEFEVY